MRYTVATYLDAGPGKRVSQDGLCVRRAALPDGDEVIMAAVCDGMGGLQQGELASTECICALAAWFDEAYLRLPAYLREGFGPIREQLLGVLQGVHVRLLDFAQRERIALGTTAAVFLGMGDRFLSVNVGDTRIYACGNALSRLTQDHSLVAREIARGRITEEEARRHPQRNVLTQCIGQGSGIAPAVTEGRLQGDMSVLLCSDGYWQKVLDREMEERLSLLRTVDRGVMTDLLFKTAAACRARGETDDISGVLIRVEEREVSHQGRGRQGAMGLLSARKGAEERTAAEPVRLVERMQLTQGGAPETRVMDKEIGGCQVGAW